MSCRPYLLLSLLTTVLCVAPGPARAQGPVPIQLFRPAMDSKGLFTMEASGVLGHLEPSFGLVLSYAHRPLDLEGSLQQRPSTLTVDHLVTGNLHATLGLWGLLEVGLALPLSAWTGTDTPAPDDGRDDGISAQGVGDLLLRLKLRLLDNSRHVVGLALAADVTLPSGDSEAFLGSGVVGLDPQVIVDMEFVDGRLRLLLNAGVRLRLGQTEPWIDSRPCPGSGGGPCGTGQALATGHLLSYSAGAAFAVVPRRLDLVLELAGQTALEAPFADADQLSSAHELRAGIKLQLGRSSFLTLGLGRGLRGGGTNFSYGSPDVRAFAGFVFEPVVADRDGDGLKDDVDRCPTRPEDFDDFEDSDGCPDPDNDRDGILDVDDRCPNEPEDKDGVEDADGCPEPDVTDRDGDGIRDFADRCPDQPEDFDQFEDADGCPDPDNDGDKILDVDDLCPNLPEDLDRFEDADGCPDPDNDQDRILDKDDGCPNEPETYNRYKDADGCPDKAPARFGKGTIIPLGRIHFETDRAVILPVSHATLDGVVWALGAHPQVLLLEIQGHADERGSAAHNLRLTTRRAVAVQRYLVGKGVDPSRLRARGYGEQVPLDPGHDEAAWSRNRRVEFVIVKRSR